MKAIVFKYLQRFFAGLGVWGTGNDLIELLQSLFNLF